MNIVYLGHSSFKITFDNGTTLITDPFDPDWLGYPFPAVAADIVTVSHGHGDHAYVQGVKGKPATVSGAGGFEIKGISIVGINSFHDEVKGAKRGGNVVYVFGDGKHKVCHLGDIGEPPSPEVVKAAYRADVLLLPVGGNYTIDAALAFDYAEKIAPEAVIPMHYKTDDGKIAVAPIDGFVSRYESGRVTRKARYESDEIQGTGKYPIIILERFKAR